MLLKSIRTTDANGTFVVQFKGKMQPNSHACSSSPDLRLTQSNGLDLSNGPTGRKECTSDSLEKLYHKIYAYQRFVGVEQRKYSIKPISQIHLYARVGNTRQQLATIPHIYVSPGTSEKKKSQVGGGGPAINPLGISTFSPARSDPGISNRPGGRKRVAHPVV